MYRGEETLAADERECTRFGEEVRVERGLRGGARVSS